MDLLLNKKSKNIVFTILTGIHQNFKLKLIQKKDRHYNLQSIQNTEVIRLDPVEKEELRFKTQEVQLFNSDLTCHFQKIFANLSQEKIESLLKSLSLQQNINKLLFQHKKHNDTFYFSTYDNKLKLQSLSKYEVGVLTKNLEQIYQYQLQNQENLIAQIYGIFTVQFYFQNQEEKYYIVLMENILKCLEKDILNIYNLKGLKKQKLKEGELIPYFLRRSLRDNDFLNQEGHLEIPDQFKSHLIQQIINDVKFFQSLNLVDYSMRLYKIDRSDIEERTRNFDIDQDYDLSTNKELNLKQIKFSGENVEIRDIYWHMALTEYFKVDNESNSLKYSNDFIEFFKKIIKQKEDGNTQTTIETEYQ